MRLHRINEKTSVDTFWPSNACIPSQSGVMTETPVEEEGPHPPGLLSLPTEIRELILKYLFQDHLDWIDTIRFPRPDAGEMFQPRFNKSYNIALCHRVFAMLHTCRALRLQSFDVYMPFSTTFWKSVMAENRELREDRHQRGDSAVMGDRTSMIRHYLNALRAEGAMHIFQALMQAEANSNHQKI